MISEVNSGINKVIESSCIVSNNLVKVWVLKLDYFIPFRELLISFLAADEREKYKNFHRELSKNLYLLRKGVTRKVISDYLNLSPNELQIRYDHKNKPYIYGKQINYNISHSSNYLMIGISKDNQIGVDIQRIDDRKKEIPISIFSKQEIEQYNTIQCSEKREFFWKTWALKEAITKATGDGMTTNFCGIDTSTLDVNHEETVELQYSNKVDISAIVFVKIENDYVYSYVLLNE